MLLSGDAPTLARAYDEVVQRRSEQVAQLTEIVADVDLLSRGSSAVHAAIEILGELRSEEAVDVLAANIAFPYVRDGNLTNAIHFRHPGRDPDLPAVKALIKIGPKAIVPVAMKLPRCEDLYEFDACVQVLHALGPNNMTTIRQCMDIVQNKSMDDRRRERVSQEREVFGLPPWRPR
jgi:hypothetical protein